MGIKYRGVLDAPALVYDQMKPYRTKMKEHFVVFYLNAARNVIYGEVVSVGTLTASLVHPREVFAPAVQRCAASIIVAHNHPSGDHNPSQEDRTTTKRLVNAGKILGIPLLDHVVVSSKGSFSFRASGLI